jgi:hypothetical protein
MFMNLYLHFSRILCDILFLLFINSGTQIISAGKLDHGRKSIFADLNSVEIDRNRISLGGPIFTGPRMSENTLPAMDTQNLG